MAKKIKYEKIPMETVKRWAKNISLPSDDIIKSYKIEKAHSTYKPFMTEQQYFILIILEKIDPRKFISGLALSPSLKREVQKPYLKKLAKDLDAFYKYINGNDYYYKYINKKPDKIESLLNEKVKLKKKIAKREIKSINKYIKNKLNKD